MPNILILSAPDVYNASGSIPYDFHKEISKHYPSVLVVKETSCVDKTVISYLDISNKSKFFLKLFRRLIGKIISVLFKTNPNFYFSFPSKSILNVRKLLANVPNPDFIIVYFMQDFISFDNLAELQHKTGAPIYLVLPDQEAMTGGCHFTWDCEEYMRECSNCPAILKQSQKYIANKNFIRKKNIVSRIDITPVICSEELFTQIQKSEIFKYKKYHRILLGIDTSIFHKKNKNKIRNKYGFNEDKFFILFGSVDSSQKRKGKVYLDEAFNILSKNKKNIKDVEIISIGKEPYFSSKFLVHNCGYIKSQVELSEIYNIADLLVIPSIQDSGPSMINQAITCGTPVVSFNIGVSADLVLNGVTGYRVEKYNNESFAIAIEKIINLESHEYDIMSKNCSEIGEEKSSVHNIVKSFLNVFVDKASI